LPQKTESEIRSHASRPEIREDGQSMRVAGYAAVFNQETDIGGYFIEIISAGAFARSLREADVHALWQHNYNRVLGRLSAGTLALREDSKGLFVEIDLPDTNDGRDVRELIRRGDISGMSFGFEVTRQEWDETGEIPKRTINEVILHEVSIVANPAYDGTSIALRSLEGARQERSAQNFMSAGMRVRMKMNLDLKVRSKA
jgi:HK97 family phage prohead protease